MLRLTTLLVPTDLSPGSERAVDWAIELAKASGGRIHLLHTYYRASERAPPYLTGLAYRFVQGARREAEQMLRKSQQRVCEQGVACESHLSDLSPDEAIFQLAGEIDADLIVMGMRGRTWLLHVLLRSTAERTRRRALCPVVTVNAAALARPMIRVIRPSSRVGLA